jgi:hypothetical protein
MKVTPPKQADLSTETFKVIRAWSEVFQALIKII